MGHNNSMLLCSRLRSLGSSWRLPFTLSGFWIACVIVGAGLLVTKSVRGSDEKQARTAIDQAFARQRALPGYVEHLFARTPVMPGAVETLAGLVTDRVKEQAVEKIQEKVAQTTAHVPVVGDLADRSLARLGEPAEEAVVPLLGPEREVGTIEHVGKREHHVFVDGLGEAVRADGQMAYTFNLPKQVAALQLAAAVGSTEVVIKEARSVRASIKSISSSLGRAGAGGMFGAVMAVFDQVSQLLRDARTSAELIRASVMLQRLSGVWQCQPDRLEVQYPSKLVEIQQLADESIGGTPTHVYLAVRHFGAETAMRAEKTDGQARQSGYQLQNQVWIRTSDGLPLRSVLTSPSGERRRTDYEYAAPVEISVPGCVHQP